jgi:hypothetical protein
MSVFLEQWDIHWWDFTVDWMEHGFNKNKFPLTIPFLQLRYIKVTENEGFCFYYKVTMRFI